MGKFTPKLTALADQAAAAFRDGDMSHALTCKLKMEAEHGEAGKAAYREATNNGKGK